MSRGNDESTSRDISLFSSHAILKKRTGQEYKRILGEDGKRGKFQNHPLPPDGARRKPIVRSEKTKRFIINYRTLHAERFTPFNPICTHQPNCLPRLVIFFLQALAQALLPPAVPGPQGDRHLQRRRLHHGKHHVLGRLPAGTTRKLRCPADKKQ